MKRYLIVGIYEDNNQRYADVAEGRSPTDAERRFKKKHPEIIIAAVIEDPNNVKIVG